MRNSKATPNDRNVPPRRCRMIRAKMVEKHVSLRDLAKMLGMSYVVLSDLLRGYRIAPKKLAQVSATVNSLPEPSEV